MNNKTPYFNQIEREARLLRIYKKADKKLLSKKPIIIEFCTQISLLIGMTVFLPINPIFSILFLLVSISVLLYSASKLDKRPYKRARIHDRIFALTLNPILENEYVVSKAYDEIKDISLELLDPEIVQQVIMRKHSTIERPKTITELANEIEAIERLQFEEQKEIINE
jgi:hypothetical protein